MGLVGLGVGQGVGTICHQFRERLIAGQGGLVQSVKRNHECPRSPAVDGSQQRQLSYLLRGKAKGNRCQVIGGLAFSHRAMIADSSIHCQYQCIDTSIHMCYNSYMTAKDGKPCKHCGTSQWYKSDDRCIACNRLQNRMYRTRYTAGGSYTLEEWKALLNFCGNKCLCCGRGDVELHADHIIPVAKGGTSNIDNIQPLCASCNSRKGAKTIDYRPHSDDEFAT